MRAVGALGLSFLVACSGSLKVPEINPDTVAVGVPSTPIPDLPAISGEPAHVVSSPGARIAAGWPLGQRVREVVGERAMVVTSHPLASEVGVDVLHRGGNAVDAAVAVAFALAVVHPVAGNIGGGGFMMVRQHDGTVHALDFREVAPAAATRDMYVDSAGTVMQSSLTGHLAVGVPGSVAGLYEAHRRLGRLPWRDLLAPAIHLARDGHVLAAVKSHARRSGSPDSPPRTRNSSWTAWRPHPKPDSCSPIWPARSSWSPTVVPPCSTTAASPT